MLMWVCQYIALFHCELTVYMIKAGVFSKSMGSPCQDISLDDFMHCLRINVSA